MPRKPKEQVEEARKKSNANLKPFDARTEKEQRRIQKKGGVASGEARRKKRDIRLAMEALLEKEYKTKDGKILSGAEAIATKQMEKALKGDAKAFELVRDSAGQKPIDKVIVAEISQDTIDEVEAMVLGDADTETGC